MVKPSTKSVESRRDQANTDHTVARLGLDPVADRRFEAAFRGNGGRFDNTDRYSMG